MDGHFITLKSSYIFNEFNYSEGVIHFMHAPKNMFQIKCSNTLFLFLRSLIILNFNKSDNKSELTLLSKSGELIQSPDIRLQKIV